MFGRSGRLRRAQDRRHVKGQKVQFYFQAAFGGNSLTLIVNGTLNEDRTQFDGDMEVAPMGGGMDAQQMNLSGSLTAVKELEHDTSSTQAVAAAAQTDAAAAQTWAAQAQAEWQQETSRKPRQTRHRPEHRDLLRHRRNRLLPALGASTPSSSKHRCK